MSIKRNIKVMGLALVAVFALSAMVASAAQATEGAPRWTVAGVTIGAGVTKTVHASSTGTVSLVGGGLTLKSVNNGDCTAAGKIEGSAAGSPGKAKEVTLTCIGVEAYSGATTIPPATCGVHSPGQPNGTVKTNDLEGTLRWLEKTGKTKAGITFNKEGATNGEFVKIEITGATCPFKNAGIPITGQAVGAVTPVGEDVTEGSLTFPETAIASTWDNATPRASAADQLKIGESNATFSNIGTGKFDVTVGSPCELFGVEPG